MPGTPEAIRIDPDALYEDGTVRLMLGLTSAALSRARRDGQLRYRRVGNRMLYRGRWLLDWLAPELDPPRKSEQP
jgi:hypothetical protein